MKLENISKVEALAKKASQIVEFRDALVSSRENAPNPEGKETGIVAVMVGAVGPAGKKTRVVLPESLQQSISNHIMGVTNKAVEDVEKELESL